MKLLLLNSPIFILTIILLSGCHLVMQLPEEEVLQITLPEWPPNDPFREQYPELVQWEISVYTCYQSREYYTCNQSIFLSFKKNTPACIVVQPVTRLNSGNSSNYFKPAGLIYPYSRMIDGQACADWNSGFLASSMRKIILSQKETGVSDSRMEKFLSTFNWKKAQESIDNKISSVNDFYNPWLIDSEKLLDNLCYGNFKSTLLNLTGCHQLNLADLNAKNGLSLLSSFIPENQRIYENPCVFIKKDEEMIIGDGKEFALIIKYKSAKNLSREVVYMPIYCKRL